LAALRPVSIAVVGLSEDWQKVYAPVVAAMAERMQVVAINDSELNLAQRVGQQLRVPMFPSLSGMMRDALCGGMIVTSPAWYALGTARHGLEAGNLLYLSDAASMSEAHVAELDKRAHDRGLLVMPELFLRFVPATLRLRELIVTSLGPVEEIELDWGDVPRRSPIRQQLEAFDLCRVLMQSSPTSLCTSKLASGSSIRQETRLEFSVKQKVDVSCHAIIRHCTEDIETTLGKPSESQPDTSVEPEWPMVCRVRCRQGEAWLSNPRRIQWTTQTDNADELLTNDRSAATVALDLFARRLAGGIVPVPSLGDLLKGHQLIHLCEQSLTAETTVDCNDESLST